MPILAVFSACGTPPGAINHSGTKSQGGKSVDKKNMKSQNPITTGIADHNSRDKYENLPFSDSVVFFGARREEGRGGYYVVQ